MAFGGGKYEEECTRARVDCEAQGVVLIVAGGKHGHGFSAQLPAHMADSLPAVLLDVAEQIEHGIKHRN